VTPEHAAPGHEHLAHLPHDACPAVFAARADISFRPPAHSAQLELMIAHFLAALSKGLADAGCTLVGHIKGTLAARGRGDLAFDATALAAAPSLTGGVAGAPDTAVLTVNVIVFGVADEALPAVVTGAWSQASDAETVWRR
jgi:hypothetical protein